MRVGPLEEGGWLGVGWFFSEILRLISDLVILNIFSSPRRFHRGEPTPNKCIWVLL
jgi:hypothetical protein